MLSRAMRAARAAAMFAYFGVGGAVMSWVVIPLATRRVAPTERPRRARALVSSGFRGFHRAMRVAGVIDHDPATVDLGALPSPCVIVANHPTLIDTPALGALLPDACFIVRHDIYQSPLLGPLLRACDHIDAGAGLGDGPTVVDEALRRIAGGASLLVFPEGTRSPPNGLRRLRRGAFEVACRARVPVVVVLLRCDPPMMHREVAWHDIPSRPGRYTVQRLATIDPGAFDHDPRALARTVERLYRSHVAAWNEPRDANARS